MKKHRAALRFVSEILTQLATLEEEDLSRLPRLTNYIRELTRREDLPSESEFKRFLDSVSVPVKTIDCYARPFVPKGWRVGEHMGDRSDRKFDPDPSKILLYLSPEQKEGGSIQGICLLKLRSGPNPTLNVNVLDYWLKRPDLVPEVVGDALQRGYKIAFPGTTYYNGSGRYVVRYLFLDKKTDRLAWDSRDLYTHWGPEYLVARAVKP